MVLMILIIHYKSFSIEYTWWQGRWKHLQSGWKRPKIILMVVKVSWQMLLFNKGQVKK